MTGLGGMIGRQDLAARLQRFGHLSNKICQLRRRDLLHPRFWLAENRGVSEATRTPHPEEKPRQYRNDRQRPNTCHTWCGLSDIRKESILIQFASCHLCPFSHAHSFDEEGQTMIRIGDIMLTWSSNTVRGFAALILLLCSIQYALLAEMNQEPRPDPSREALNLEACQSFSVLVDLIADSRVGLHGNFSIYDVKPIEAPPLDIVNGVATTQIFAEDEYLQRLMTYYGEYYQVDPLLVQLIMEQESGFDPFAMSPAGAMGLMQLMPDTAWMLGVDDPWDPEQNIEGGVRYFSQQMDRFGRVELALAAYNAGPGAVEKWGGVPPYPETLDYVNTIMGRYSAETKQQQDTAVDKEFRD